LRADGLAVLENFFDASFCASAVGEIKMSLADPSVAREVDSADSDHRLWALDRIRPGGAASILAGREDLNQLSAAVLETQTTVAFVLGAHLQAKPGNLGSGGGWHRDTEDGHQFKAILYLTDVGPENGPYQYLRGSNSPASMLMTTLKFGHRKRYSDLEVSGLAGSGYCITSVCGPAGTVVLTDTLGVHRGSPIRQGERLALTTYVTGIDSRDRFLAAFSSVLPNEVSTVSDPQGSTRRV